jgi:N-acetyl-anhydromuramyl-L-alanine amidase AmpD
MDSHVILPAKFAQGDLESVPLRLAKHFTRSNRKISDVLWVVLHSAECSETHSAAENLAAWAAGPQAPRASWHFAVDQNSITQSVLERDVAWHAPGANARGIGVQHAGRAGQLASGWGDLYSHAMLALSAALVAGICRRWDIPVQRVGPEHLKAGTPGICGHYDVTRAFKKSSHVDPGKSFPWDDYLDEVQRFHRKSSPSPSFPGV